MEKAKYLPTNENIIILKNLGEYLEIFVNGDTRVVPKDDVAFESKELQKISFSEFRRNLYLSIHDSPASDIVYSHNSSRLVPEPHQYKPLFKFLNSENNRILIADEVGLGKTIEAGMIFKEVQSREDLKISLIVVPPSLTYKWKDELAIRFGEYFDILNTKEFIRLIREYDQYQDTKLFEKRVVISYHTLRDERVVDELQKSKLFEVDFLVMDEAHNMRNSDTSTFESAELITSISHNIVFLSATPVQNRLSDLFNILSLLDSDLFMDYEYFEQLVRPNAFIHALIGLLRNNAGTDDIKAYSGEALSQLGEGHLELKNLFLKIADTNTFPPEKRISLIDDLVSLDPLSFIINRTKKKDVGRLIPRSANSISVVPTSAEMEYYEAVIDLTRLINPDVPTGFITIMPERMASSSMIASLRSFEAVKESGRLYFDGIDDLDENLQELEANSDVQEALTQVIRLGKALGSEDSKYKRFISVIRDLKDQGIKQAIVFSFFKHTLKYLHEKLIESGFSVGIIHGDFKVAERYATIQEFREGRFDILLSSEVGSEGLDMQHCNVVINYDLPWNPMRVEQRIGRIDRIGQQFDKLHIFSLTIAGSIEDRIISRLYEKLRIFESSVGELEPIIGDIQSETDVRNLLKLTDKEIDEVLHVEELGKKRIEVELTGQTREFEKLLNDDYQFQKSLEDRETKNEFLVNETRLLVISHLENMGIRFVQATESLIHLNKNAVSQLISSLKDKLSNRQEYPHEYKEERAFLNQLSKLTNVKLCFDPADSNSFETIFVGVSSPLVRIILKGVTFLNHPSILNHRSLPSGFVAISRFDLKSSKDNSVFLTSLYDTNAEFIKDIDFKELTIGAEDSDSSLSDSFEAATNRISNHLISRLEGMKLEYQERLIKQIDVKISSVTKHFDKRIAKSNRYVDTVNHLDVQRMKLSEIGNLEAQKRMKLNELENLKKVSGSFKLIGVIQVLGHE